MSWNLRLAIFIFSLGLFIIIIGFLRSKKIPIKYALVWILSSIILFFVALTPSFSSGIANRIGFEVLSNLVVAIFLILLLYITLVLTMIVSDQRKKMILLIQEISLLKQKVKEVEIHEKKS